MEYYTQGINSFNSAIHFSISWKRDNKFLIRIKIGLKVLNGFLRRQWLCVFIFYKKMSRREMNAYLYAIAYLCYKFTVCVVKMLTQDIHQPQRIFMGGGVIGPLD